MSPSLALQIALAAAAITYAALAGYVWINRGVTGSGPIATMLVATGVWTVSYAIELTMDDVASARWWSGLKFIGIVTLGPALWAFVAQYSRRGGKLPRQVLALLAIEPIAVLVMLAVPATHDLIHYYPPPGELTRLGNTPVPKVGDLFWPHAIYTYLVMLSAVLVLAVRLIRVARPYRRPAVFIVVTSLLPFLGNLFWNLNATAGAKLPDPAPFLFSMTAVVLVWGFFRLRLLDLVPVARNVVIEQMADGVLVLDAMGRVVDANPASAQLLGTRRSQLIGRDVAGMTPQVATIVDGHRPGTATRGETVIVPGPPGPWTKSMDVAVSVSSVTDSRGRHTAHLVVLRDITERKVIERRLRELLEDRTRVAETLQQSLRPATLPEVPGLRLAARSIPAGPGGRVSGDFYDVHPGPDARWAFVLGDVSGKGVHAAVVTSMARYTVRTLSAQGWGPKDVLRQLNHALAVTEDVERFCTVAYGQVTPLLPGAEADPAGGGGVRVRLALGGHPQPLLRRAADGSVAAVGEPGTALGLMDDVDVTETVIDLAPGDALVAFTDGVVEARRDGHEYGEDRLVEVLRQSGATRPGMPLRLPALLADDIADAVMKSVEEYSIDRDDVAILVLCAT